MKHHINTTSFQAFKESCHQIPVLSKEEEVALAQNMTEENRELLITHHLRFVVYVVQSYRGYKLSEEDLVQEGIAGLIDAVSKYDVSKGVRLASFAIYNIRAHIHSYVMKNFRVAKIVTTKAQRRLFFGLRQFIHENNDYTMEDVAHHFNTTVDTAEDMYCRLFSYDVPFEMPGDDEDEPSSSPHLTLESPNVPVDQLIELQQDTSSLYSAIESLQPRQEQVIRDRWLSDQKITLKDIASRYGVSCERARQIELQALNNLRKQMR